jgi:LysM repeat protein
MSWKKPVFLSVVVTLLTLSLGFPGSALAGGYGGCGSSYVVQWGDTLGGIAAQCGTTVDALQQANPNLGYWLYAGQTISMPGGYQGDQYGGNYYGGQYGNNCYGNNCYGGQYGGNNYGGQYGNNCYGNQYSNNCYGNQYSNNGYVPYGASSGGTYVVQWGDTMRRIADRMGVNLNDLIAANPQLWNPSMIYAGQVINMPGGSGYMPQGQPYGGYNYHPDGYSQGSSTYTVCRGDTLKIIAARFGTTVDRLLSLNPQIWNPNWIFAGQVIRIW